MTYNEAEALFTKARNKERGYCLPGRLGQTRLVKTAKGYGIRLHATIVVEILKGDEYVLNSGGWRTPTTKERINLYGPVHVWTEKRVWYVGGDWSTPKEKRVPFHDGIRIRKGKPVVTKAAAKAQVKTEANLKRIKTYVDKYIRAIESGTLPEPSGGDCWGCCMQTDTGASLGDVALTDHLESHLKESYLVPSLIVNALKEKGYNPAYVNPWNGLRRDTKTFRRALRDYLVKRLAFPKAKPATTKVIKAKPNPFQPALTLVRGGE